MYSARDIIFTIIEEEGYTFSMRPVNLPWAKGMVLALLIQMDRSEKVIEFYAHDPGIICAHASIKHYNGHVSNMATTTFNLVHPNATETLKQYLEEHCFKRSITIEFEDNWNLNYTYSEVV